MVGVRPRQGITIAIQRLRYRYLRGVLILRYHRVVRVASDPHATCVSPARFREHLEVLARHYQPLALSELVRYLNRRTLPRRGVVVTLDDGYRDNLIAARPILADYGIPATIFATSDHVGDGREFWWDDLERVFLSPGRLPETLRLTVAGRVYRWDLGTGATFSRQQWQQFRAWTWRWGEYPTERHRLFREVFNLLQPLAGDLSRELVRELVSWGGREDAPRPTHRILDADELRELGASELIEVGAHSRRHPLLCGLSPAQQWEEILGSKARLERLLQRPVTSFAYPYGVVAGTASLVKKAGFDAACTTTAEGVFRGQDIFRLPRVYVGNWDGDEFDRHLRWIA